MRFFLVGACTVIAALSAGSVVAAVASPLAIALESPPSPPIKPGFHGISASSDEGSRYEQGRRLAVELLDKVKEIDEPAASLARKTSGQLARVTFQVAADAEGDRQCVDYSLFVNHNFPEVIFICANTRWHVQHAPTPVTEILAQSFIHEGAHLASNVGECEATGLELVVMQRTIGIQNDGNFLRYAAQCYGFSDYLPPARKSRRKSHLRR